MTGIAPQALVYLVYLVYRIDVVQPKRDEPNKQNKYGLRARPEASLLLEVWKYRGISSGEVFVRGS